MSKPLIAVAVALLGLTVIGGAMAATRHASIISDPATDDGALPADDPQLGRRIYVRCQACHGLDGQGIAGNYPPLAGDPVVNAAEPDAAIRAVIRGRPRARFNGEMPAFDDLADHEIAAVLTWVRGQWGNHAEPLNPAIVARIRSQP